MIGCEIVSCVSYFTNWTWVKYIWTIAWFDSTRLGSARINYLRPSSCSTRLLSSQACFSFNYKSWLAWFIQIQLAYPQRSGKGNSMNSWLISMFYFSFLLSQCKASTNKNTPNTLFQHQKLEQTYNNVIEIKTKHCPLVLHPTHNRKFLNPFVVIKHSA